MKKRSKEKYYLADMIKPENKQKILIDSKKTYKNTTKEIQTLINTF